MYLRTKFQLSSTILTSTIQTPKKPILIRINGFYFECFHNYILHLTDLINFTTEIFKDAYSQVLNKQAGALYFFVWLGSWKNSENLISGKVLV